MLAPWVLAAAATFLGAGLGSTAARAVTPAPPGASPFTLGGAAAEAAPAIRWVADFEQALEQAEILRRPIMVDVWAQWCHWCHELDRRTYSHPEVIRRAEAITCAKVNADRDPRFGRQFAIRGLPTILFFDHHGQEVDRVRGFLQADPFAQLLDDVVIAADQTAVRAEELRRDPKNPARMYALADELLARSRFAEAEPLLAGLTPDGSAAGSTVEADAVLDLAVARQGKGDAPGARKVLAGFLDSYPDSPRRLEAELRLGQLLAEKGDRPAARRHLEAVVSGAPASWKAAEAERLLQLIDAGHGD